MTFGRSQSNPLFDCSGFYLYLSPLRIIAAFREWANECYSFSF